MKKIYLILISVMMILGCSKKYQPQTAMRGNSGAVVKTVTAPPVPKTLDVPDKAAMRDMDGRLYYDLRGHRYWKNYVDGKYYLFNKSMYTDPAFKPH